MLYEGTKLRKALQIKRIYTIHYYEYDNRFEFEGEAHPFWELAYADRGKALINRDGGELTLHRGMAVLYAPGVYHTLKAEGAEGLDLFVVSFDCQAPELHRLAQTAFPILQADRHYLSAILEEAREAFLSPLDDNYYRLRRRDKAVYGSEQLIALNLQGLLIALIRRLDLPPEDNHGESPAPDRAGEEQLQHVIALMRANLAEPLGIEELCKRSLLSRSKLQRLFQQHTGQSALNYYIALRVDAAKSMMRNRMHSYSEIADLLGFSSIHYFSRQFKKVTGITPTEYSASLRSLSDRQSC